MILLIDNYDSFSYNLVQFIGTICKKKIDAAKALGVKNASEAEKKYEIKVIRNDAMTVEEIKELAPDAIVLSPGPGRPVDAGICEDVLRSLSKEIPTLGVCLGHQAICEVFGATITYAKQLMHGKQSKVTLDNDSKIFKNMAGEEMIARYHSLAAEEATMPDSLKVTARTADGEIMAVEHKEYPIYGVQFHPESVLTPNGMKMLENFVDAAMK